MRHDARMKCARCRRFMRRKPTVATPLKRASRPHDKLCVECAPVAAGEFRPSSQGQISALHAKCNALGRLGSNVFTSAEWKQRAKDHAAETFDELTGETSFLDYSYEQASTLLDWLDKIGQRAPVPA